MTPDYSDYAGFTNELKNLFISQLPLYICKAHDKASTKIEVKPDNTPAIDLDNYSLERIRALISSHFPDDCTIGEEDKVSGEKIAAVLANDEQLQWTIDGLDGTWHFIRGTNSYGAMVSRRRGNTILFSAIFRPVDAALRGNGFFWAVHRHGVWEWCEKCGRYHLLHSAKHRTLERMVVMLEGSSKRFFKPPISLLGAEVTTRPSLSSCIAATTVARGDATAIITAGHKPWDAWPIVSFVEEAGGIVTDYLGRPRKLENCSDIVAAANKTDHAHIIEILNSAK